MSETQHETGRAVVVSAPTIPPRLASALPPEVLAEVARLAPAQQAAFVDAYRVRSKSLFLAYLTSLLYCHYALLGRWAMSGIMFVSLFCAAAVGWVWWLIDLVRMPRMVREYNDHLALEILRSLEGRVDHAALGGA
jgi:hypothetical protein